MRGGKERWITLIAFLCLGCPVLSYGQNEWGRGVEEPRWFRIKVDKIYAGLDMEGQYYKSTIQGETVSRGYLSILPTVGIDLGGSVYHSHLLDYDLGLRLGPQWQQISQSEPPGSKDNTVDLVQDYDGLFHWLKEKPYATTMFASKGIYFRNFDFFNRTRIDSQRAGGTTGYTSGPVPVRLHYIYRDEETTGTQNSDGEFEQHLVTTSATHVRQETGQTEATYQFEDYFQAQEFQPDIDGQNHNFTLFDRAHWGREEWIRLSSSLLYIQQNSTFLNTDSFTFQEQLRLQHLPRLSSDYRYTFAHRQSGGTTNNTHEGNARLTHRLYESLVSTGEFNGFAQDSTGGGTSSGILRFGGRIDESYTKLLGEIGRLSLGYNLRVFGEYRDNSGSVLNIIDERQTLTDNIPSFLNNPNVIEVTSVTNLSGVPYRESLDYLLIPQGVLMEIRRVPGGQIPNGSTVLVTYTAELESSDDFVSVNHGGRFRVSFLDSLVGIFSRFNIVNNYGGESLVLQDLVDITAGLDFSWEGIKVGMEYEDFDSNLQIFRAWKFFQSFLFSLAYGTHVSFDFTQNWTDFTAEDVTRKSFGFLGRLRKQLYSSLFFAAELGYRRERGRGFDQDLFTARPSLIFALGQLDAQANYEFQWEDYLGDIFFKHYFFVQVNRRF